MNTPLSRRALFAAALLVGGVLFAVPARGGSEDRSPALERQMLQLIDRERQGRGLSSLRPDPILTEAARAHSADMAEKGYFHHVSPTPGRRTPMDRYTRAAGGRSRGLSLAENIYHGSRVSITAAHRGFMESPGHRDNVLGRGWRRVGVGVTTNARGEIWVTQMFSD